jgi:hypothetical protein
MIKKAVTVVLLFAFMAVSTGSALAVEGDTIYKNAIYGATIGGLIGVGLYGLDQKEPGQKIGGGVVVGTVLGILLGMAESKSLVTVDRKKGTVALGIPAPVVALTSNGPAYQASLLKMDF